MHRRVIKKRIWTMGDTLIVKAVYKFKGTNNDEVI